MLKGFKEFISQGNVIDLAVAVIIGGAFKPIVDKVTETIMGIIGQLIGSPNFDSVGKFSLLSNPQGDADYIYPGAILTQVINFLLIAAAVYFCIVLPMNKFKERMKKSEPEAPAEPTDVELLTEIRDLLAKQKQAFKSLTFGHCLGGVSRKVRLFFPYS